MVGNCTAILPRHVYGEVDLLLHQPYGVGNTVGMHTTISPFLPRHGYWEVDLLCRICVTRKFGYEEAHRARCPTANCYFDFVSFLFFLFLCFFQRCLCLHDRFFQFVDWTLFFSFEPGRDCMDVMGNLMAPAFRHFIVTASLSFKLSWAWLFKSRLTLTPD